MESPLLDESVVENAVDYTGRPVRRSTSGGWRSASFIIVVEVAERFAYFGVSSNLINFLTDELHQSTATAAENVNALFGAASLLPILGAFLADSFLGQYRTIVISSILYILALGFLTLSATLSSPNLLQVILFFFSMYLLAFAQGGHKPCVQAFGANQFDEQHPEESKSKSSFFNWWYFFISLGTFLTVNTLIYVQDWSLGFGITCISMAFALLVFLLGTRTYRYCNIGDDEYPFVRIGRVFITAARNWRFDSLEIAHEQEIHRSAQFSVLNKALMVGNGVCSFSEVGEAKAILRLVPIWVSCLAYAIVFSQSSTFFTKQGVTMDRSLVAGFEIPAATLQSFISVSIVISLPVYDRVLVPLARGFTGRASGITMLQRIGFGMVLSAVSMIVAASVEIKRLETAREYGLVDMPMATVPMGVWWLVPQYVLIGVSDSFTMVFLRPGSEWITERRSFPVPEYFWGW